MPVITVGAFSGENAHTVVGRATHNSVYLRIEFMTYVLVLFPGCSQAFPMHERKAGWGAGNPNSYIICSIPGSPGHIMHFVQETQIVSKTPLDTICVSTQTPLDTICDLSWTPLGHIIFAIPDSPGHLM